MYCIVCGRGRGRGHAVHNCVRTGASVRLVVDKFGSVGGLNIVGIYVVLMIDEHTFDSLSLWHESYDWRLPQVDSSASNE